MVFPHKNSITLPLVQIIPINQIPYDHNQYQGALKT